jgi:hypothetical protein
VPPLEVPSLISIKKAKRKRIFIYLLLIASRIRTSHICAFKPDMGRKKLALRTKSSKRGNKVVKSTKVVIIPPKRPLSPRENTDRPP